jgi:hypothetical protein
VGLTVDAYSVVALHFTIATMINKDFRLTCQSDLQWKIEFGRLLSFVDLETFVRYFDRFDVIRIVMRLTRLCHVSIINVRMPSQIRYRLSILKEKRQLVSVIKEKTTKSNLLPSCPTI